MDSQGSSFIPKSPVKGAVRPRGVRKIYVFTYISSVIFIGTIMAAVGTYAFQLSVQSELNNQKNLLNQEKERFSVSDIARMELLDQQLRSARELMNSHVSVPKLFEALEFSTTNALGLIGFSYTRSQTADVSLEITALANSIDIALFQRNIYRDNNLLRGLTVVDPTVMGAATPPLVSSTNFKLTGRLQVTDFPYEPRSSSQVLSVMSSQVPPTEEDAVADESADDDF